MDDAYRDLGEIGVPVALYEELKILALDENLSIGQTVSRLLQEALDARYAREELSAARTSHLTPEERNRQ